MRELGCAICGEDVSPDLDHVEVTGEHINMNDRNTYDEYVVHPRCWQRVSGGWTEPA